MTKPSHLQVSRREREIMEIIYRRGQASVSEVLEGMVAPPSYSAVRAMLRILEEKGHLKHKKDGRKYVYVPTVAPSKARRSAVRNLLQTFFDNSVEKAIASLIDMNADELSEADFDRLSSLIDNARKQGSEL